MALKAVGFDIDGTLYPDYRFNVRLVPWVLTNLPLLLSLGRARDSLRRDRREGSFYQLQAELAAVHLKRPADEVRVLFEEKIYRDWTPIFSRIRTYGGVRESILALRAAGIRIGALSDFPARDKLQRLGLDGLWDCAICSEEVGQLKPAPDSFLALADALGAKPEEILYVGNSPAYDVLGARAVGMKAACIARDAFKRRKALMAGATFTFSTFDELRQRVLDLSR